MSENPVRLKVHADARGRENPRGRRALLEPWRPHRPWRRYLLGVGLVALATLLGVPISSSIAATNLVMIYLATVVIAAIYLGRGPSVVTALLGVMAFDFFFVPPRLTLAVADTQYFLTFAGLLIVGLVISTLTARVGEQADAARRREIEAMELYGFSRDLAAAFRLKDILQSVITHVGQTFDCQVIVLLPEKEILQPFALTPGLILDKNESAVATWSFRRGEAVGRGTRTLSAPSLLCVPLKAAHGIVGVLGIKSPDAHLPLRIEQQRLLESFASQAALAIERAQFAEQARKAQVLQETEKLQGALLNSISHDLRTPLVTITGTLSSLQEDAAHLDDSTRRTMVETAYGEAQRLNHLVGNLLDMTRIEAGAMKVRQMPCDVQDVIGSALDRLADRLKGRKVTVDLPPTLPLVPMDFVLMVQVLVNLLDNALKYSPADGPIQVAARVTDSSLEMQVADHGIGIPSEDLTRVFDKFYRVQRPDGVTGTGLGLAICKGILEAHRGKIKAEQRDGGGTVITIDLPLNPSQQPTIEEAV